MISDSQLYTLALFFGAVSMLLIVLYHFMEVNSTTEEPEKSSQTKEKS
jgi:oligosaccharyl transferase complex subunit OST4